MVLAPKLLWERFRGKKHPAFLQRLGFFLPKEDKVIWIHAVSVGEVKAAAPFLSLLKEKYPQSRFCFTTTTATGFAEAKKNCADIHLYLPLDFSYAAKRFVQKLNPEICFLIEGDIWPNLLKAVKKNGGKTILVSGKISERSYQRCLRFPKFSSKLFSNLDLLCVQNREYAQRFASFAHKKVQITGNLKFDIEPQKVDIAEREYITIACTHPSEEEMILDALKNVRMPIFIAPRHPERFSEVAALLTRKNIHFAFFRDQQKAQVILIDEMGQLAYCYARSKVALVGGSFVPGIGGHNLLEPLLYGCLPIFGPFTYKQKEIVSKIIETSSGIQTTVQNLEKSVQQIIVDYSSYLLRSSRLLQQLRGATNATWNEVHKIIRK
ncbi:MAG TPA: glycosyltransferase N-terminal domain-containing protein [Chlamydiales bacterium]|nr:glycosyltransferase N-terminal domain-containing protein [Chlamydiales bacterium]